MTPWLQRTFAALEHRGFRILWFGSLSALVGFFMSTVVQGVVAFDLTGNNSAVGFVVFGQGIAQLLLQPFGGALADRMSKKLIIMGCQFLTFITFVGLALLLGFDLISMPALVAGSFLNGIAFSFLGPARQAWVVDLVSEGHRGNAIALNQVALNASRVLGPGLAGLFLAIDVIGATGAYAIMAAFYAFAIVTTVILPNPVVDPASSQRSVFADVLDGVSYVRRNPRLRTLIFMFVGVMMVGFPYVTVLPGYVENSLGQEASMISVLLSVTAVGALAASMIVASLADSPRAQFIYSTMGVLFGVSLIVCAFCPDIITASGAMLLLGITSGAFQTLNGAVIIRETETRYFGRVLSLTFLAFAFFGLMGLPIGFFADFAGERATLFVMGAGVALIALVLSGVISRLPSREIAVTPASAPGGR